MTDVTAPPYLRPLPRAACCSVVFSSPLPSPNPRRRLENLSPFRCRLPFSNRQPPRSCLVLNPSSCRPRRRSPTRHSNPHPHSSSRSPPRCRRDAALLQPCFPLAHAPSVRRDRLRRSGGEMLRSAVPAPRPRPRAPPPGGLVVGRAGGRSARASRAAPPLTLRQLRVKGHLQGTRASLLVLGEGSRRILGAAHCWQVLHK